ncbi:MAG: hypothetical protein R3C10_01525 [Pirellulales bacterium]
MSGCLLRLSYWCDLAREYAPAHDAMVHTRDTAEASFRDDLSDFDLFHDVASLNDFLGDWLRTADLFGIVAANDHETAARLYRVAERHLVRCGRYRDCAPFLDVPKRLALAAECFYYMSLKLDQERQSEHDPPPKVAGTLYANNVATLIALLVINDRPAEAKAAHDEAIQVCGDADVKTIIDAALLGHFPDPI